MSLKSALVAKVVTKITDKLYQIGTAYPISEGVIITAFHVFSDIDKFSDTWLEWIRDDDALKGKKPTVHKITEIIYQNEEYDLVLAKCVTPDNLPMIRLSPYAPESDQHWESVGYSDAGIDSDKSIRIKDPAGGTYLFQKEDHWEQHLKSKGDVTETTLWKGMSGAPVFTVGTNELTAIISKVPDNEKATHKERIYVTSIAYVLENCEEFQQALSLDHQLEQYIEKQQIALQQQLKAIQVDYAKLYKSLALAFSGGSKTSAKDLTKSLLKEFSSNNNCVEALRLVCEPFISACRDEIEVLLLRLLVSTTAKDQWTGQQLHHFKVRTRILCELKLASRYQAPPQLKRRDSGEVAGLHAIQDHSAKEVGFDLKDNAIEQAKAIAYYLYKRTDDNYDLDEMETDDWQQVSKELATRRKGEKPELIRFEIDARKDKEHPLALAEVRKELYKLLPELPIVLFGSISEPNENCLRAHIKVFYEKLEEIG